MNSPSKRRRVSRIAAAGGWWLALGALVLSAEGAVRDVVFDWQVVVNNGVTVPGDARKFNSYNQPSVNVDGLVVFRARSKGGTSGEPAHGVYTRDVALRTGVIRLFDRATDVPQPNNLGTTFVEPPSFPRIDQSSNTIASRGNHQPVWTYVLPDGTETRAGTTGVYTNPFGGLIAGASNLGAVPGLRALCGSRRRRAQVRRLPRRSRGHRYRHNRVQGELHVVAHRAHRRLLP